MIRKLIAGAVGAGATMVMMATTPALAGKWVLNPRACPDLVEDRLDRIEDRRDARVTRGPLDRIEDRLDARENRRDRAVPVCPARAFAYKPGRPRWRRIR